MVGSSTGPLTVGPIIAAPTLTGVGVIKLLSISLSFTPGDEVKFAILFFRFLFCYKYSIFYVKSTPDGVILKFKVINSAVLVGLIKISPIN